MSLDIKDPQLPPPANPMTPRDARVCTDLIIHHTAGPRTQTVHDIDAEHRAIGDAMIGYNYFIDDAGLIWRGRPVSVVPAATYGRNPQSLNVCLVGNFHTPDAGYNGPPSAAQLKSLEALCVQLHLGYPSIMRTIGHRDVAQLLVDLHLISPDAKGDYATACPGDDLAREIPTLVTELRAQLLRR
jgi:N-acetylmuramoyl-L-alanine amidase